MFEWSTETEVARWELSAVATSTRLTLTACLDSDDVDVAAAAGADHHACFDRLVRYLEDGSASRPFSAADFADLAHRYADAAAVALADAD